MGQQCFVGYHEQNLFRFVFGSIEPDQTVRVEFKYYVPLGPDLELHLPFSFEPKLLSNPGNVDQNQAIRGGMTVTVSCPEYIVGITDMKTSLPVELDNQNSSRSKHEELNLHWKFHTKEKFDQSTKVSAFKFSDIVSNDSQLWGKFGIVIDHRIEVQPTELKKYHLHFMVDFSTDMTTEYKEAIIRSIVDYYEGPDRAPSVSITCFGRTSKSWTMNDVADISLENWISEMKNQKFGKLDNCILAERLGELYERPNDESCPRQIILITKIKPLNYDDVKQVTNAARAIDLLHNRTFVTGIDDVSMSLCEDIAKNTGGQAEFCCNLESFSDCFRKQISLASSKPSHKLSKFNASITDHQIVCDPSDFRDSGFHTATHLWNPIFDGQPSIDIGSNLDSRITNIQTGFILNDLESIPVVNLDIAIESLETGIITTTSNFSAQVPEAQPPNVSFYNYVKSALDRRLLLRVACIERSIIDLSKTTNVLCSKTSFCGIKMSRARYDAGNQTQIKRARFG